MASKTRRGPRGTVVLRTQEGRAEANQLMRQRRQLERPLTRYQLQLLSQSQQQFDQYQVDPASLTYDEVETFFTNSVMNRVKKTKEYQRQEEQQQAQKKRGFWGTIWHGFKRAVSWVWDQFKKLMDVILKAAKAVIKFIWNNGGEEIMRTYVAREMSKIIAP